MKITRLLQIAAMLAALFASVAPQPAFAQSPSDTPVIMVRAVSYWEASLVGFVDPQLFEKWPFSLDVAREFAVTAVPVTPGFTPVLILLDLNGNEITRGTGTLTTTQPAGEYAILVQPESTGGFYQLTFRQAAELPPPTPTPTTAPVVVPGVTVAVEPASINVGESATVTVGLAEVPADGYSSAEFTCTYDATLTEASGIATGQLFGADSAVAINGPQNGGFIVAIAGSNGNKATASGPAFTFSLKGLQGGQMAVDCKARVSSGNDILTDIQAGSAGLTVAAPPPGPSGVEATPTPTEAATEAPTEAPPTPTPEPVTAATLTGQVHAAKPVTVTLYDASAALVSTAAADSDGKFSLTAPAGAYTVLASAAGFLDAQGSVTLTDGQQSTLPEVSLLAGDIDGNHVIDQFDAMTIGMSYNTAEPAAADLNNDGVINVLDLELLARNYRASGALAWQ